jgi:hypothetical protein
MTDPVVAGGVAPIMVEDLADVLPASLEARSPGLQPSACS